MILGKVLTSSYYYQPKSLKENISVAMTLGNTNNEQQYVSVSTMYKTMAPRFFSLQFTHKHILIHSIQPTIDRQTEHIFSMYQTQHNGNYFIFHRKKEKTESSLNFISFSCVALNLFSLSLVSLPFIRLESQEMRKHKLTLGYKS